MPTQTAATVRSQQRQSYLERLANMVEPVSNAAALLGVSRQYVLKLIQGGALEAVKIGKDWFVSSLSPHSARPLPCRPPSRANGHQLSQRFLNRAF